MRNNQEYTKKLMNLRRLLRGKDIELTLQSNTNKVVYYCNKDIEIELLNKDDIAFITLEEIKTMSLSFFFSKRLMNIIDFYCEDKTVMDSLSLEDIYIYLGIDKFYTFNDDGTIRLMSENDYATIITELSLNELDAYLKTLNIADIRELTETAIRMFKENELTDYKKLGILESNLRHLNFDDIN